MFEPFGGKTWPEGGCSAIVLCCSHSQLVWSIEHIGKDQSRMRSLSPGSFALQSEARAASLGVKRRVNSQALDCSGELVEIEVIARRVFRLGFVLCVPEMAPAIA